MIKYSYKSYCTFLLVFIFVKSSGQDPHYSQFFTAPHLMNPANSGAAKDKWQLFSNYRQQWANAGTPFNTFHAVVDARITSDTNSSAILGGSLGLLSDQSLNGAFKSNYLTSSVAVHLRLDQSKRVSIGILSSYGTRTLDFSQLTFGQQFTSGGFDVVRLPTGEPALKNMKPFFSIGTGIRYEYTRDRFRFDIGAASYHLNKPKQTMLSDPNQVIPLRAVGQLNATYVVNSRISLVSNICYQSQAYQSYFSLGGAVGYDFSNGSGNKILYLGSWYRDSDAIYPYAALRIGQVQIGLSYDATVSKQNEAGVSPQSMELSLILRKPNNQKQLKNTFIDSTVVEIPALRQLNHFDLSKIRLNELPINNYNPDFLNLYACKIGLGFMPPVEFKTRQYLISPIYFQVLNNLADRLRNNPGCRLAVIGSEFKNKFEKQLSWDRVSSVIDFLVEKEGISRDRLLFIYDSKDADGDKVSFRIVDDSALAPKIIGPPHPYLRNLKSPVRN